MVRELLLSALAALAAGPGCKDAPGEGATSSSHAPSKGTATAQVPADQPPLASKENFRIDATPAAECAAGKPCEAQLLLTALGDYKVNKDYPFKFVADATPGVAIDGNGEFAHEGKQRGVMKVHFRAEAAGTARLEGTFKLSVCTEATCAIEDAKIAFAVPVI